VSTQDPTFDGIEDRRSYRDRRRAFRPAAVYEVGEQKLSILDLLGRFREDKYQDGAISRLADMHMKVGQPIRYRLDSDLVPLEDAEPLSIDMLKGLMYPLLRPDQIEQLEAETPNDVDAAYHLEELDLNFRINVFHDSDGPAAVIRSLPREVPRPDVLGFPDPGVITDILNLRQGLVIISGITGSGKSTTIASILGELNRTTQMRIITLEDPVEYVMTADQCLISQREVGRDVRTFSAGLRSALREDPDIIFVGEIRDTETASLALSAAETGHLVVSTLHTRDAAGVISRIVDLFPPERTREVMSQLSFSLSYIIAQKLLPKKDNSGRVGTFEILKNVSAISNLIRTGNWHQIYATMQLQAKERMMTLEKHLMQLVNADMITLEMALRYANDPSQLNAMAPKPAMAR
jgi:twitching motility protein PilT